MTTVNTVQVLLNPASLRDNNSSADKHQQAFHLLIEENTDMHTASTHSFGCHNSAHPI